MSNYPQALSHTPTKNTQFHNLCGQSGLIFFSFLTLFISGHMVLKYCLETFKTGFCLALPDVNSIKPKGVLIL